MVAPRDFGRRLCFEDLPTAGAITIFAGHRNILDIVDYYMQFFVDESCGYCTPCRVGNVFLRQRLEKIRQGQASPDDLDYLRNLGKTISQTSRCGLGHSSPNPVLSAMENFPEVFSALLKTPTDGRQAGFDLNSALVPARQIALRESCCLDADLRQPK
jgi:[NiFe] hydrogenase diaphorase moiety large subunit